jgi:hypothetical protein
MSISGCNRGEIVLLISHSKATDMLIIGLDKNIGFFIATNNTIVSIKIVVNKLRIRKYDKGSRDLFFDKIQNISWVFGYMNEIQ